jgi:hypothetical protein
MAASLGELPRAEIRGRKKKKRKKEKRETLNGCKPLSSVFLLICSSV